MNTTIEYYNKNAKEYAQTTRVVDMQEVYDRFEKYLLPNSHILDVGCGSGRDAKYFKDRGYPVVGLDASEEICRVAEAYADIVVYNIDIKDLDAVDKFDAVWACASLLHIPKNEIRIAINNIILALKRNGVLYASFKAGEGEVTVNERFFAYYHYDEIYKVISKDDNLLIQEMWKSEENRQEKIVTWINIIAIRR